MKLLKWNKDNWEQSDSDNGEKIKIYKPNPFSMKALSYNLLSLSKNEDISSLKEIKNSLLDIDKTSNEDEIGGLIQYNGYFSQIGIESRYYLSLNLKNRYQDYQNFYIGWYFMPIEKWIKMEKSPVNNKQYLEEIVIPVFEKNWSNPYRDEGVEEKQIKFTPKTSNEYVAVVFAFNKTKINGKNCAAGDNSCNPATDIRNYIKSQISNHNPITIDWLLNDTNNINVAESTGMKINPKKILSDFQKVDKSIIFKNQMILYGNSNTFYISDVKNFTYFPMVNNYQIQSSYPIISMSIFFDSLIIATNKEQFILTGNSPQTFKVNELNDDIGVYAPKTVKNNDNFIFQLTNDGVYKLKTLFNFRDRYNVEKVDSALSPSIKSDGKSSAIVWNNKYIINIPSEKVLWIYYNDYKSWIKYKSEIFDLFDMKIINNNLLLIEKKGFNIYRFDDFIPNEHGEGGYKDKDMYGNEYDVESIYKSKEIDFSLPNHNKKFKKLHTRFADTPGKNELFVKVWVDSKLWVSPDNVKVEFDETQGQVIQKLTRTPSIITTSRSIHDLKDTAYASQINNIGNKHDEDIDQLHEVIVAANGRQIQFEVIHTQNKKLNIKNFANLIKVKKPKALRTTSRKV